jgi:hypothetical protein
VVRVAGAGTSEAFKARSTIVEVGSVKVSDGRGDTKTEEGRMLGEGVVI